MPALSTLGCGTPNFSYSMGKLPSIIPSSSSQSVLNELRLNHSLSSCDVDRTQRTIAEANAGVAQYEIEIARLEGIREEMARKRDALRQYIQQNQALLAPVRRMPPEILSQIIRLSLPEKWYDYPSGHFALPHTQVCAYWRATCLSMRDLWSSIRVSLQLPLGTRIREVLETYFIRSGDVPLSITIEQFSRLNWENEPICQMIMAQSMRWQRAHLALPASSFSTLEPIRGRLAQLEALTLGLSIGEERYIPRTVGSDIFADTPKLHTLSIMHPLEPSMIQLPWQQITRFESHWHWKANRILDMLTLCPNLLGCHIYDPVLLGHPKLTPVDEGSTVLPCLTSIQIKSQEWASATALAADSLFHGLTAPSITSIDLRRISMTGEFISMLSRSTCQITTFSLRYVSNLTEDMLIACLEMMPSLVSLTYKESQNHPMVWTPEVSRRLTPTLCPKRTLLPRLNTFRLQLASSSGWDTHIDMVEARWLISHGNHILSPSPIMRIDFLDGNLSYTPLATKRPKVIGQKETKLFSDRATAG